MAMQNYFVFLDSKKAPVVRKKKEIITDEQTSDRNELDDFLPMNTEEAISDEQASDRNDDNFPSNNNE